MSEPDPVRSTEDQAVSPPLPRAGAESAPRAERADGSVHSPHLHRFRTAAGILVGLAVAALLIAVTVGVSASRRSAADSARWSPWAPSEGGALGARDIADFVAPLYRISPVNQLAVVTVVNLQSSAAAAAAAAAAASGVPASTPSSGLQVAVRPNPSSGQLSLLTGNTIAFNLCGIGGKSCAIGIGKPSSNRLLLLRREALELALYTFRYIDGVRNVVAILPPGHTQATSRLSKAPPKSVTTPSKPVDVAILFQRQELSPLLNHPLSASLPEQVPPSVSQMAAAPEAGLVDQVTARGLFSEQLQQAQDGSALILLNPLPPQ
ncbi:MAG: hypothetical protein M3016_09490 [Actinomycetota bacterium]|nr:hypothetical protein [Actinomycetota bacterium]